jgi:hypothetical protein
MAEACLLLLSFAFELRLAPLPLEVFVEFALLGSFSCSPEFERESFRHQRYSFYDKHDSNSNCIGNEIVQTQPRRIAIKKNSIINGET